ncbi:hypothetical protein ATY41_06105 [Leifsonia xyli subsp. xyli]|nr:hypothetical protein [Leifsonia xyli]ODA89291.1 hypothetical protein ATY41_06105 [Leifsonia xyli subsp. xyli]
MRERLAADRAALERLDDDHYDGLIDRATWSRQRNRIMDRLVVLQREYEDAMPVLPIASTTPSALSSPRCSSRPNPNRIVQQHPTARTI